MSAEAGRRHRRKTRTVKAARGLPWWAARVAGRWTMGGLLAGAVSSLDRASPLFPGSDRMSLLRRKIKAKRRS